MRFRTLALALALCSSFTIAAEAATPKQKHAAVRRNKSSAKSSAPRKFKANNFKPGKFKAGKAKPAKFKASKAKANKYVVQKRKKA
jgi:hypothetical protein